MWGSHSSEQRKARCCAWEKPEEGYAHRHRAASICQAHMLLRLPSWPPWSVFCSGPMALSSPPACELSPEVWFSIVKCVGETLNPDLYPISHGHGALSSIWTVKALALSREIYGSGKRQGGVLQPNSSLI